MTSAKNPSSAQPAERIEEYDVVILGGGTGSTIAAWTFASEGKRVAVIDRKYIGGSCPNIACLPSKNIIHSAKVASYFRRSKEFGINHNGFTIDMSGVRERKRKMVHGLNDMYLENYKKTAANVHAAIVDPVPPPRITTSYSSILSAGWADEGFFVLVMRLFLSERQVRSWLASI
jgi:pyruvate/2-oxoglutarate dehydrogenase complex dihydrolipoamide dehydrogenase (E3) component